MLKIQGLVHRYQDGSNTLTALEVPYWEAREGEAWCITGPSGSGKSTLLHCIAGLLHPTEGDISWDNRSLTHDLSPAELDQWRARSIGYLYQKFNLLPFLTAAENILAGAWWGGVPQNEARQRMEQLTQTLDIHDLLHHYPDALSQGEQQRVALARALIKEPPLILADEPTANLDAANSQIVLDLLQDYVRQHHSLLLITSHDSLVIDAFPNRLPLSKGGRHAPQHCA